MRHVRYFSGLIYIILFSSNKTATRPDLPPPPMFVDGGQAWLLVSVFLCGDAESFGFFNEVVLGVSSLEIRDYGKK